MEFGKLLSKLRKERSISQKRLAELAGISTSHLSLIENGKDLPSLEAAERCMDALELEERYRKQLRQALKRDRNEPVRQTRQMFYFGQALKDALQELDMTLTELSNSIKRPFFTVHSWAGGSMLPSDKTLTNELIPALRAAMISEASIRTLRRAHLKDVLTRSLNLAYLEQDEKDQLLTCFFNCLV